MEDFNAAKQNKVPIPNIAKAFGVEWISAFAPFLMLPLVLMLKSGTSTELWASELDGQS